MSYAPVHRVFGAQSEPRHVPAENHHQSSTPLKRWINERPDESPYHIIGSIAVGCATSTEKAKQQVETVSNQATAGSWFEEVEGK